MPREDLDGDVALQPRVAGAIDLAHAAGAEGAGFRRGPNGSRVALSSNGRCGDSTRWLNNGPRSALVALSAAVANGVHR